MIILIFSFFINPDLSFKVLNTEHFEIIYPESIDSIVRRFSPTTEEVYSNMKNFYHRGKLPCATIVLLDNLDIPSGFSYHLPRNTVFLFLFEGDFFQFGSHEDWLKLVFIHEYTHIIEGERTGGIFTLTRKFFGRTYLPYYFQPIGLIEGFAVYSETKNTVGGRIESSFFKMVLQNAGDKFPSLTEFLSVDYKKWPYGMSSYIFGSGFFCYLDSIYGEEKVKEIAGSLSSNPLFLNPVFNKVTGKNLSELWKDYRILYSQKRDNRNPELLTEDGGFKRFLVVSKKNISYAQLISPYSKPYITINNRRYDYYQNGRGDFYNNCYYVPVYEMKDGCTVYGKVLRVYFKSGKSTTLKDFKRVNGITIDTKGKSYYIVNRRKIVREDSAVIYKERGNIRNIDCSPSDTLLVFDVERGKGSGIFTLNLENKDVKKLIYNNFVNMEPIFSDNERWIFFSSDMGGEFGIYAYDIQDERYYFLTEGVSPGVKNDTLYFLSYKSTGFDVAVKKLDTLFLKEVYPKEIDYTIKGRDRTAECLPSRSYNFVKYLLPGGWEPVIQPAKNGPFTGFKVSGFDPLNRFSYGLGYIYKFGEGFNKIEGSFVYSHFVRPTFNAHFCYYFPGDYNNLGLGMFFPEENLFSQYGFGLIYEFTKTYYYTYNTLGLSYYYSNVMKYPCSISPEGFKLNIDVFEYREGYWGANYSFAPETYIDIRDYFRIRGGVMGAVRFQFVLNPTSDLFKKTRNIRSPELEPIDYQFPTLFNLSGEIRLPIYLKPIGRNPFIIRNISGTVFYDVINVYDYPSSFVIWHIKDILQDVLLLPSYYGFELNCDANFFNWTDKHYRLGIGGSRISGKTYIYLATDWAF